MYYEVQYFSGAFRHTQTLIATFTYQPYNAALIGQHQGQSFVEPGEMMISHIIAQQLATALHAKGGETVALCHRTQCQLPTHGIGIYFYFIACTLQRQVFVVRHQPVNYAQRTANDVL